MVSGDPYAQLVRWVKSFSRPAGCGPNASAGMGLVDPISCSQCDEADTLPAHHRTAPESNSSKRTTGVGQPQQSRSNNNTKVHNVYPPIPRATGTFRWKRSRLRRILQQHGLCNGTALFLPYDQGLEHGPRDFFSVAMLEKARESMEAGATGLISGVSDVWQRKYDESLEFVAA